MMPHALQPGPQAKPPPLQDSFLLRLPKPQSAGRYTRALRQSLRVVHAFECLYNALRGHHSSPNSGGFNLPAMRKETMNVENPASRPSTR